jgi:SAM-dependent methyltransferase
MVKVLQRLVTVQRSMSLLHSGMAQIKKVRQCRMAHTPCANSSRRPVAQYDEIAELYDGYPGNYLEDILFFVEEAQKAGSPILEIGVGTGRLAFCLAAAGLDVVGIDSSPAMLRVLQGKRAEAPALPGRLRVLAADVRAFSLRPRFSMAIAAFRTFLYLFTRREQRRALRAIRRHLAPGGRLAMSFFVPPPQLLAEGRTEPREMTRFPAPDGSGEVVASDWTEWRPARQRVVSHMTYEWRREGGLPARRVDRTLAARYMFPEEVPPLLEGCGYRIVEAYGGFDRSALADDSREQIWIAEPELKRGIGR